MICLTFIEKLGSQRPAIGGKAEEVSDWAAYECGKSTVKHRTRLNMMIKQMLPVMENYAYFSFFSKNETQLKSQTITTRSTPTTLSIILHLELLGLFNFYVKFQINYRFRSWICVKHACSGKYDKAEYPPPAEIDIKALNVITTEMSSLVDFIF